MEKGAIIGGKPIGGGIGPIFADNPGTGGIATAGGIGGGIPPSIGGGIRVGAVPIKLGELVPALGGSYENNNIIFLLNLKKNTMCYKHNADLSLPLQ